MQLPRCMLGLVTDGLRTTALEEEMLIVSDSLAPKVIGVSSSEEAGYAAKLEVANADASSTNWSHSLGQ